MSSSRRKYNPDQSTIFDIPGVSEELPVHPSITDFVVHNRHAKTAPEQPYGFNPEMEPIDNADTPQPLLFMSFGSGSSGNCAYIGTRYRGVLIDAGVDPETVYQGLRNNGLSINNIEGICITHDHSDHVRYAYTLVRKHPSMGIYCTPKTLNGLLRRHSISRRIKDYHRPIYKEFDFRIAGLTITPFDVSHDGTDNCGFFITDGTQNFTLATDLGCITERVDHYMSIAHHVMLESNYDATMLRNGPYPQYLKARIAAERGHLDNMEAGQFLTRLAGNGLRYIFLCHLSKDNNTPEIALETIRRILGEAGFTNIGHADNSLTSRQAPIQLTALPRYGASPLFILRPE